MKLEQTMYAKSDTKEIIKLTSSPCPAGILFSIVPEPFGLHKRGWHTAQKVLGLAMSDKKTFIHSKAKCD